MARYIEAPRLPTAGVAATVVLSIGSLLIPHAAEGLSASTANYEAAMQSVTQAALAHCGIPGMLVAGSECQPKPTSGVVTRILKPASISTIAPWERWAHTSFVEAMAACESSDNPEMKVVNSGVFYSGLYSDNGAFWKQNGGLAYAQEPYQASREQQDHVNYNAYERDGNYDQWECGQKLEAKQ